MDVRARNWMILLRAAGLVALVGWFLVVGANLATVGRPFPGFLFEPNLLVSTIRLPGWSGTRAGLRSYDRIMAVEGQPVATARELDERVQRWPVGTVLHYELQRGGRAVEVRLPTQAYTWQDALGAFGSSTLAGLFFIVMGVLVIWLRPDLPAAGPFMAFMCSAGLFMAATPLMQRVHVAAVPFLIGMVWVPFFGMHLALDFPRPVVWLQGRWRLLWLYTVPALLSLVVASRYRARGQAVDPAAVDGYFLFLDAWSAACLLAIAALIAASGHAAMRATSMVQRQQALIVLLGLLGTFGTLALTYMLPVLLGADQISTLQLVVEYLALNIFPLAIAYAIVRHQLFDLQFLYRRMTLYTALVLILGTLYGGIVLTGHQLANMYEPVRGHQVMGMGGFLAALVLVFALRPLHALLRRQIDRFFLGERADALALLTRFNEQAGAEPAAVAQQLVELLQRGFHPRGLGMWLEGQLVATAGQLATPPERPTGSGTQLLPDGGVVVVCPGVRLQLGPRPRGIPYNAEEISLLRALATQARLAFDRARLFQQQVELQVREGTVRALAVEREQLLRQIVHDLSSDLFSMTLGVSLLRQGREPERVLASMERSLGHMHDLLEEKIAYLRSGRSEQRALVLPVLARASDTLDPVLASRQQRLEVQVQAPEARVPLSELELEQVLMNLLTNAAKFSPPRATVWLFQELQGAQVVLRVEDEGSGIAPEVMARLGTGLRADPAIPGAGLGLQNVRALVERVGGSLSWCNRERGARFEVRLPEAGG